MPKFTIADKDPTEEMECDERVDNQEILGFGVTKSDTKQAVRSHVVHDRSYSCLVLAETWAMIMGNAKLLRNVCRMRNCVETILPQNKPSFFVDGTGGEAAVGLEKRT